MHVQVYVWKCIGSLHIHTYKNCVCIYIYMHTKKFVCATMSEVLDRRWNLSGSLKGEQLPGHSHGVFSGSSGMDGMEGRTLGQHF